MEELIENDTLGCWQAEGRNLIQQNYKVFLSFLSESKDMIKRRRYVNAAAYVQIAAFHAQLNHCGFFASPQLEQLLLQIGQEAGVYSKSTLEATAFSDRKPERILHVATSASFIGGSPKLMQRWIQQDYSRSHSVALTDQFPNEVPEKLKELISKSNGTIHILNDKGEDLILRAKKLREVAMTADIIVLNLLEYDVIPTIAFANKKGLPPIIYANVGDHWFWVGASIGDVVANLRESGMRLSKKRRGIEERRNMLLPTVLDSIERTISRSEAKKHIGIDDSNIMLLSVARGVKYRTVDGASFADAHIEVLKQHENAILFVIGPGNLEDWSDAIHATQGRIRVLGETRDTSFFYQAADIYVDSFPFVSITSLLEAGSYGIPLVTRYPFSSDDCEVLGADMPGLTGNLIRVETLEEYTKVLSSLIEDEDLRLSLGSATEQKIKEVHSGQSWLKTLNTVYSNVQTLNKFPVVINKTEEISLDKPDVFLPRINGIDFLSLIHWNMKYMSFDERFSLWLKLVRESGFKKNPLNLLMSEPFRLRYYSLRSNYYISKLYNCLVKPS